MNWWSPSVSWQPSSGCSSLWGIHSQAQMDAIAVTGKPIDDARFKKLWPGVSCQIEKSDGSGQWQGLRKIDLTLSKKVKQKNVEVQFTRFVPAEKGGGQ
ncbi:MAG: hypothetical protein ACYTCN_07265 [Planctomycetota bacterium]